MVLFYNADTRAGAKALIDAGGVLGSPEAGDSQIREGECHGALHDH